MKLNVYSSVDFYPYHAHNVATPQTIKELSDVVSELLATYGGDAGFSLSSDDDGYVQQTVLLSRLETDEEYAERIAHEDAKKAEQRSIREAQYLKLKAEFEDKQK